MANWLYIKVNAQPIKGDCCELECATSYEAAAILENLYTSAVLHVGIVLQSFWHSEKSGNFTHRFQDVYIHCGY